MLTMINLPVGIGSEIGGTCIGSHCPEQRLLAIQVDSRRCLGAGTELSCSSVESPKNAKFHMLAATEDS